MGSSAATEAKAAGLDERLLRHRLRVRVATGHGSSFTVNLGPGGYCTEQMRVPPVGTRLEGCVSLDGQDVPFVGHVVWASVGEHRLNQPGRMGVRFDRVHPGLGSSLELRAARSPHAPERWRSEAPGAKELSRVVTETLLNPAT